MPLKALKPRGLLKKNIRDKILNFFDIYVLTSSINEMSIRANSKSVSRLMSEHGLVAKGTRKT